MRGASHEAFGAGSLNDAPTMKHTPAVTNCANVSATGSMTRLHLPRHTRLNEKITAHSSVNRSPVPIVSPPSPDPSDTKPTPVRHRAAATMLRAAGRCRISSHETNGTSTQYAEVRNALRPGSIIVRPTVWLIIVPQYVSPVTSPGMMMDLFRYGTIRLRNRISMIVDAPTSRNPISHCGVTTPIATLAMG